MRRRPFLPHIPGFPVAAPAARLSLAACLSLGACSAPAVVASGPALIVPHRPETVPCSDAPAPSTPGGAQVDSLEAEPKPDEPVAEDAPAEAPAPAVLGDDDDEPGGDPGGGPGGDHGDDGDSATEAQPPGKTVHRTAP